MPEHRTITFSTDLVHAFQFVNCWHCWRGVPRTNHKLHKYYRTAQILDITLYERDWQLYYEGLVLRDHYEDAFDRNLVAEKPEQDRRR